MPEDLTPKYPILSMENEIIIPPSFQDNISQVISGWRANSSELSSGKVKIQATAERILLGDASAPLTGIGIFLGKDGADYEFRVGDPATKFLHYDGTEVNLVGSVSGRSTAIIAGAINSFGELITANLNTSTKNILGEFVFSGSGALAMATDANNGLWISPTGILGKKAGATTFAIDTSGNATFAGTLTAAAGTLGAITIGTNAWHVNSSGNMWWGSSATYAGATIKISSAGSVDFTTGNFSGTLASGISITSPTITGGTITGGTIRTATSGMRIELSPTWIGRQYWYNSSNQVAGLIVGGALGTFEIWGDANGSVWSYIQINNSGTITLGANTVHVLGNITITGTVDGVDISAHAANASAHHSSVSNGLHIIPASVRISGGLIDIGYTNAYDILPYSNNYGSIGYNARRWDNGYFNKLYCSQQTANKFITGDLEFKHKGEVAFRIDENPDFLSFYNKDNQLVMKLSRGGDILIKGKVKQL